MGALLQASPVGAAPTTGGWGKVAPDDVGRAKRERVGLGRKVGLGCGVGGIGVSVGMAACVMATIALAAATAEACIIAGSTVGVAGAHAALDNIMSAAIADIKIFICFFLRSWEPQLMQTDLRVHRLAEMRRTEYPEAR
jgi:hypothetical protein